jgi:hypothetical protein
MARQRLRAIPARSRGPAGLQMACNRDGATTGRPAFFAGASPSHAAADGHRFIEPRSQMDQTPLRPPPSRSMAASAVWTSRCPRGPLPSHSSSSKTPGERLARACRHRAAIKKPAIGGRLHGNTCTRTGSTFCRAAPHRRDAVEAVRGRDGYEFEGSRLRCELARGPPSRAGPGGGSFGGGGGGYGDRGGFEVPRGRAVPPPLPRGGFTKGSKFRVMVKGLPPSASWQDLKVRSWRSNASPACCTIARVEGALDLWGGSVRVADRRAAGPCLPAGPLPHQLPHTHLHQRVPRRARQGGGRGRVRQLRGAARRCGGRCGGGAAGGVVCPAWRCCGGGGGSARGGALPWRRSRWA